MKMFHTTSAVLGAEYRLEQSKRQLGEQMDQVRSTLMQPSSLLVVTALGALLGFWSARRKTAAVASGSADNGAGPWPLVRSTVFALLIRFVAQRLAKLNDGINRT